MSQKLVLLDCDGTLVDSQGYLQAKVLEAIAAVGGPIPPPEIMAEFHALTLKGFFAKIEHLMTPEQIVAANQYMIEEITRSRSSGASDERTYPGIIEALDALTQRGYLLGIVTNKYARGLELVLKGNGIYDRFITYNHSENAPPKPAPNMVLNGMRDAGVDAPQCVVVGDSLLDVLAAKNAGVGSIAVTWAGRDADELRQAGAWAVIDRVSELVPTIERYWQAS
jgi:phosphoglycolate phosphatase